MALKQRIVASLDIGSNKIVCLIGYINANGKVFIKGFGHQQAKGIYGGKIVNKKEAEKSILSTISIAERMAGFNIQSITVNINTAEVASSTINSNIKINNREVKNKDIFMLLKDIKNILKKEGKEIVHLIPLQYEIDGDVVENPYGMTANDLKINFHLLSTPKSNLNKINECIKAVMLNINNYVSNAYASSLSVLEDTEKELGVLLLDIGYSNTNMSFIYNNKYLFESSIPVGGDHITKDISSIFKTNQNVAEKVKVINTNFTLSKKNEDELIKIEIDDEEDFKVSTNKIKLVNDIAKARIEEIVNIAMKKLENNKLNGALQYIVLTGGTALIPGIDMFINNITNIETRIGYNEKLAIQDKGLSVELKSPVYSVSVGILKFIQNRYNNKTYKEEEQSTLFKFLSNIFGI